MRIKTEAKRREIIDAAALEFGARGYHKTTLADVARRMGSSKATIYNYYKTKDELLAASLAEKAIPAAGALLSALAGNERFECRLNDFAKRYLAMHTSQHAVSIQRLVVAEKIQARQIIDAIEANAGPRLWPAVAACFTEAQAAGALREGSIDQIVYHFRALLSDLPYRLLIGSIDGVSESIVDRSAEAAVECILAAYGAR
ncbi:TetR/AcrR family transcriptional regulator [Sphingomonas tabacisoli]|uniref:TetR/AcrR family transcriptional regulator n=1 Tax=Sphingomonas tabacisoli TaxID=2249466 RepID=A0ABW4I239_9SPHN